MNVKEASPEEAWELMQRDGYTYLDVRSIPEFEAGHPEGAVNVPLLHLNPASRQMVPNLDFLAVVQRNFAKETKLVVGCGSGQRSFRAADILQQQGYSSVCNVEGGFHGARDPAGRVIAPGWLDYDLPVSEQTGEGVSYESLAAKAKP